MKTRDLTIASRVLGIMMFFSALLLTCFGIIYRHSILSFRERAMNVQGTVVELLEGSGGTVHVVADFTDASGKVFRVVSRWSTNPPEAVLGQKINVFYDPKDPTKAEIGDSLIGSMTTILVFLVPIMLAGGVACFWVIPYVIRKAWPNELTVQK